MPPSGFGYPLGGVSSLALESVFQLSTLLGFALQSLNPTPRPARGFPRPIRPGASLPNPSAWHRRFGGLRSRGQPCFPRPAHRFKPGGAVALLGLRTSRVFVRRTFEEASPFFVPLSFFLEPQGSPSDGLAFPLFRRALTRLVFSTDGLCRFFGT